MRSPGHAAAVLLMLAPATCLAKPAFCDHFAPASSAWGDQRGGWRSAAHQYDAAMPNNNPPTYTDLTTYTGLKNFTVAVTVNDLNDGGVWLRSTYNGGQESGVLLVTGGATGTNNGFYWHVVTNGSFSGQLNPVSVPNIQGKTVPIRIVVKGTTYQLFINGGTAPVTTLTDSTFATGSVGLYDFSPQNGASSPRGETFSKFCLTVNK